MSSKESVIAALSANQTLERLEIANFTNLEGPDILAAFLIGCASASASKLKYVDMSGNRLDKDAMDPDVMYFILREKMLHTCLPLRCGE